MHYDENEPTIIMATIESGDLLGWASDNRSTYTDLVIKGIRRFTNEDYGHVGIAWRVHDGLCDELLVLEATMPRIRVARVTTDQEFYCVPMNITWSEKSKNFLLGKLGLPYGVVDAIRGGTGHHVAHDMKWQCAEYAHAFYEMSGVLLPLEYTPGRLIANAEKYSGKKALRVIGPGRTLDFD